jgi:hypothetical protein
MEGIREVGRRLRAKFQDNDVITNTYIPELEQRLIELI